MSLIQKLKNAGNASVLAGALLLTGCGGPKSYRGAFYDQPLYKTHGPPQGNYQKVTSLVCNRATYDDPVTIDTDNFQGIKNDFRKGEPIIFVVFTYNCVGSRLNFQLMNENGERITNTALPIDTPISIFQYKVIENRIPTGDYVGHWLLNGEERSSNRISIRE